MNADTAPSQNARIVSNSVKLAGLPRLSVLIPFYKESPCALLNALGATAHSEIEVVVLDDGSQSADLTHAVSSTIDDLLVATRLITLRYNEGRARGRNRLAAEAKGDYVLFLDADMLPDSTGFLDRWLSQTRDGPAVVFGGFSLRQAPTDRAYDVHRVMALKSHCLDVATRSRWPEKHVYTCNLLVRRDVIGAQVFATDFNGWGWEDVEWATRVVQEFGVRHIDNPATHMGLDRAEVLARKFEQSVGNFGLMVKRHRDAASKYPSYRLARLIRRLPLRRAFRSGLKRIALIEAAPPKVRALALRVYRAALYSDVV